MNANGIITKLVYSLVILYGLSACSQEEYIEQNVSNEESGSVFHARMKLTGDRLSFSDTRVSSEWQNGDKVYLQLTSNGQMIYGKAIYKSLENEWDIQYYGNIIEDRLSECEAYYFENPLAESDTDVSIGEHTGVYADKGASYIFKDGVLHVTATLSPLTGRIRLEGTPNEKFKLAGFNHYTKYIFMSNSFDSTPAYIDGIIGSNGYSSDYYGYFEDEGNKMLTVIDMENWVQYDKTMKESTLKQGHSGNLRLPTINNSSGWSNKDAKTLSIYANGVSFNMIGVSHGTFTMGATPEQYEIFTPRENECPTHKVTLDSYYIAETEVTQALWYAVTGYKPTTSKEYIWYRYWGVGDKYPAYYISYDDCLDFIEKLNKLTGKKFRIPTEAEWEFAARGGNKSKGYMFSGGNELDKVGWNYFNCQTSQPVKTRAANELGLYDMSGNVEEFCADYYGYYSDNDQVNPTGPVTGDNHVVRGGSWHDIDVCHRVSQRWHSNGDGGTPLRGLRLAL